eukprot:scaffold15803_cov18-Tisochrysis_lutea.AAC.3
MRPGGAAAAAAAAATAGICCCCCHGKQGTELTCKCGRGSNEKHQGASPSGGGEGYDVTGCRTSLADWSLHFWGTPWTAQPLPVDPVSMRVLSPQPALVLTLVASLTLYFHAKAWQMNKKGSVVENQCSLLSYSRASQMLTHQAFPNDIACNFRIFVCSLMG